MINTEKLKNVIRQYKQAPPEKWLLNEIYKLQAVKNFQDNWDIEAEDFHGMLVASLSKTFNLLASVNNFPAGMIEFFAEAEPEKVRAMFKNLYDETQDVADRILQFKADAKKMMDIVEGAKGQHFQYENAVSVYLWLRYPDKYYIYKFGEVKAAAKYLESNYQFKKGHYKENLKNFYNFYNEIQAELKKDDGLRDFLKGNITADCYPDPELCTMTVDICFFINHYLNGSLPEQLPRIWKISHGTKATGISDENKAVFEERKVVVVDGATNGKANSKYTQGELFKDHIKKGDYFYLCYGNSIQLLGKITSDAVPNPELQGTWLERKYEVLAWSLDKSAYNGEVKWWTPNANSTCIRVDNNTLFETLILKPYFNMEVNELEEKLPVAAPLTETGANYWFLNANPKMWSFSSLAVGEVIDYTLYNENKNKRRVFQNFLDAKAGDTVICYESTPVKQIVAIARVSKEQDGERIYFEKIEGLENPIDYSVLRDSSALQNMEYFSILQGSLFKLQEDEYNYIMELIREANPIAEEKEADIYTEEDFLNEVYMDDSKYSSLVSVLKRKKNIILQGAPGVGKTFAARRLAYSIMGEKDDRRIELIQFHQNYSYEDFVMGYKPNGEGFELKYGTFYRFCKKAENQPDKDFFFIIDEINRGNMSKIFGELLMLIEKDYRGTYATLAYNGMKFTVPENLYIIGMMNTADRSLAMIDYALRRRFSFFEIEPAFDNEKFNMYCQSLHNDSLNKLLSVVKALNESIKFDKSLGSGFCIGHSYFCGLKDSSECSEDLLRSIVEYDIIPMLNEYWFDDEKQLNKWTENLRGVFHD